MADTMPSSDHERRLKSTIDFLRYKAKPSFATNHKGTLSKILCKCAPTEQLKEKLRRVDTWQKAKTRAKWVREVFEAVLKTENGERKAFKMCAKLCRDEFVCAWWTPAVCRQWLRAICVGLNGEELERLVHVVLESTEAQRGEGAHFAQTLFAGSTGVGKSTIRPLLMYLGEVGLTGYDGVYDNEGFYKDAQDESFSAGDWKDFGKCMREAFIKKEGGGEKLVIPKSMPQTLIQVQNN
jgi:hypothetical protein